MSEEAKNTVPENEQPETAPEEKTAAAAPEQAAAEAAATEEDKKKDGGWFNKKAREMAETIILPLLWFALFTLPVMSFSFW